MKPSKCRHFNGTVHRQCKAGVLYKTVNLSACFPDRGTSSFCEKQSLYSQEEIAQKEEASKERLCNTFVAIAACLEHAESLLTPAELSKGDRATWGKGGSLPCPVCGTGTLQYAMSACNGHIHGRCSTPNCMSWMQ